MKSEIHASRWDAGASSDVPERGRLVVDADGLIVGIFRIDGELHAYENRCAHMRGPVCQGLIVSRVVEIIDASKAIIGSCFDDREPHIVCPWHGAEFSIRTGRHAGHSSMKLRTVPVEEYDGRIYLTLRTSNR
ncbi:Rieske (2Fe-2S) protein [Bradyrhizobium tropiciagri]|uniref:Rieske (2Fe-2S) protein n=1 Tax=Bradyrhizobium tropiciagri TaxID=312253 RepID=UPI00067C34B7|nr:Rieske (2Fe-2S) protein [Bradyrhizobium tropiciagri]